MTFNERVRAIERIHHLISMKATGSPDELASKINVSRSTIYEFIECMRCLGGEIEYSRSHRSFYYTEDVKLELRYRKKVG